MRKVSHFTLDNNKGNFGAISEEEVSKHILVYIFGGPSLPNGSLFHNEVINECSSNSKASDSCRNASRKEVTISYFFLNFLDFGSFTLLRVLRTLLILLLRFMQVPKHR